MREWRDNPRGFLLRLFNEVVASAQPSIVVPSWVRSVIGASREATPRPAGETPAVPATFFTSKRHLTVFGAGKASAAMAQAFEQAWPGPVCGLVITRYGHAVPCKQVEIVEASHPIPDQNGLEAAARMLEMARGLTEDDLVVCLISGGGSALLTLPAEGITLEDKQNATSQLLKCGATIQEINTVRKHLSRIKGGRLAESCAPATAFTLMISDVPGDDPATIASGPTVPDPTTSEQAVELIERYGIEPSDRLKRALSETPKPGNSIFEKAQSQIIASPMMTLQAASQYAEKQGLQTRILSDCIEGNASDVGAQHAQIALEAARNNKPILILSGGETTVQVKGTGRGGRNVEFLASLVCNLDSQTGVNALAADTDGIDGIEEIAGAVADPTTMNRAKEIGLNLEDHMANNDCHTFFELLGDSIVTGPTRTNVNDFRAILVVPE